MSDVFISLFSSPNRQGFIYKKGKAWPHKWHKRFFVLQGSELLCYKNSQDTEPHGRLKLLNAVCTLGTKECEFQVTMATEATALASNDNTNSNPTPNSPTYTLSSEKAAAPLISITNNNNSSSSSSSNSTTNNAKSWKLKALTMKECDGWVQDIQKAILYSTHFGNSITSSSSEKSSSNGHLLGSVATSSLFDDGTHGGVSMNGGSCSMSEQLRRMSLPVHMQGRVNTLNLPNGQAGGSSGRGKTGSKHQNNKDKNSSRLSTTFRRLSVKFLGGKMETQQSSVEEKPTSLVEQYFREQEILEQQKRHLPKGVDIPTQINTFDELQKLIQEHDGDDNNEDVKMPTLIDGLAHDKHSNVNRKDSNGTLSNGGKLRYRSSKESINAPINGKEEVSKDEKETTDCKSNKNTSSTHLSLDKVKKSSNNNEEGDLSDGSLDGGMSDDDASLTAHTPGRFSTIRHYKEEKQNELDQQMQVRKSEDFSDYSDGEASIKSEGDCLTSSSASPSAASVLFSTSQPSKISTRRSVHIGNIWSFKSKRKDSQTQQQPVITPQINISNDNNNNNSTLTPQSTQSKERRKSLLTSFFSKK